MAITAKGTTIPIPIFPPVDIPLGVELLDELEEEIEAETSIDELSEGVNVGVGEATVEIANGAAVVDVGVTVDSPKSCKTSLSVDCHLICMTSA